MAYDMFSLIVKTGPDWTPIVATNAGKDMTTPVRLIITNSGPGVLTVQGMSGILGIDKSTQLSLGASV